MNTFEYLRPTALAEVVQVLQADPEAKLLAGGQSLLAAMKLRFAAPSRLIDLQALAELRGVQVQGDALWIGAMCTHAQVATSALVREWAPMLAALAGGIGDQQVRNRGTLGGSIANADPAACWPAGVLAGNATVCTDQREIRADDFFQGLFTTALAPDEVVLGVRFPRMPTAHYRKFEQPASRFALTGVAVAQFTQGVRVALTGLGNGVTRWREAEEALSRQWSPDALSGLCFDETQATGDVHASAEYRAHLALVLTRSAVQHLLQMAP
jgi:carbon-monoxide dehydrogenase medium subunit